MKLDCVDLESATFLERLIQAKGMGHVNWDDVSGEWDWLKKANKSLSPFLAKNEAYLGFRLDYDRVRRDGIDMPHFDAGVFDFIGFNFQQSEEVKSNYKRHYPLGAFNSLSLIALKYTIFYRQNQHIKSGLYPLNTDIEVHTCHDFFELVSELTKYDDKQRLWEDCFYLGLASTLYPTGVTKNHQRLYDDNELFKTICTLIYMQEKTLYSETLPPMSVMNERYCKLALGDHIYSDEDRAIYREILIDDEKCPLANMLSIITGSLKRNSRPYDRAFMAGRLYSGDKEWTLKMDGQLMFFHNEKLARIVLTSNTEFERALSIATQNNANEICIGVGDTINIINIRDALDRYSLLMALSFGSIYPQYSSR
jgi:hypothetical protein